MSGSIGTLAETIDDTPARCRVRFRSVYILTLHSL